ncbi:4-amino-4-deoxychorismate synthase, partial [Rhodotorula paludigena]|uniref:4-amino-4-deoxychorismate synthase n=1 Tax=Rhodotorula paludigena TaxID=86838 RepID=UPI003176D366
ILDFHDSYTLNLLRLVHELAPWWDEQAWKERVVVTNVDSLSWDSFVQDTLPHFDCVVLGPGPGTPHRSSDFSWPKRLVEELGDRLPLFGLCLGHQGLATTFGGKVVKAAAPKHGQVSRITHNGTSALFRKVPNAFDAVQYNSLVVDPDSLPAELEPLAWTQNAAGAGALEIMALQHRTKPLWGVQFHPESISSAYGAQLIDNFLRSVVDFHQRPCRPDLPAQILELATSYRPKPSLFPVCDATGSPRYEQRTLSLDVAAGWTPQLVFEQLIKGQSPLGEVWLDSARPTGESQYSHLFTPQTTCSYSPSTRTFTIRSPSSAPSRVSILPSETFFSAVSKAQSLLRTRTRPVDSTATSVPIGFVGHVGYEMKAETMPLSGGRGSDAAAQTGAELAFASLVLSYAHETSTWRANGLVRIADDCVGEARHGGVAPLVAEVGVTEDEWDSWIAAVQAALKRAPPSHPSPETQPLPTTFSPDQSRDSYMASIESARRSIIAGDAYELCLTTQFRSTLPPSSPLIADPYPLYLTLRMTNPAPYSAYFHLPQSDLTLLSSSPERFLRIHRAGHADMKPIKGTVRRTPLDPVEDERRRSALEADEKERAENLMIVDLIRNDLLRSCEVASVKVDKLMRVETYETVHQLVTTVVGQLGEGVNPFEAMAAAFPPGSMTGAPKLRSLQLLDELEKHVPRGVYSGVFGYLAVDGASDWSVVIRTLVKRGRELSLGAGGAITHLSDAAKEWEEVLTKVDAVLGRTSA